MKSLMNLVFAGAFILPAFSFASDCPTTGNAIEAFKLIDSGSPKLCDYLEQNIVTKFAVNAHCETMYMASIRKNNESAMTCLERIKYSPRAEEINKVIPQLGYNFYEFALSAAKRNLVLKLKSQGGKISPEMVARNYNELLIALLNRNDLELYKLFLESADLTLATKDAGTTAFMLAARTGSIATIKTLIELGAKVDTLDSDEDSALAYASNIEVMKYLIQLGLNPLTKNKYGSTLLHFKASSFDPAMSEFLVDLGIDINALDNDGVTALIHASKEQSAKHLASLIRLGADVNVVSKDGFTALREVIFGADSVEKVKLLLDAGAHVHNVDKLNASVLSYAAAFSSVPVIQLLLKAGADTLVKTNQAIKIPTFQTEIPKGSTPKDIARTLNRPKAIIDLL